jgi:hypothetical protein
MSVPVRLEYDLSTDSLLVKVAPSDGGEVTLRKMPLDALSAEDKRRPARLLDAQPRTTS